MSWKIFLGSELLKLRANFARIQGLEFLIIFLSNVKSIFKIIFGLKIFINYHFSDIFTEQFTTN